jgi:hypothetical protein
MKVYINPGHDLEYDSGAVHTDEYDDVDGIPDDWKDEKEKDKHAETNIR